MIRRLKYNEIDFEKYTQCLENSEQRKYSATRDFLDITAKEQWEILVYKDYEAVMPIPFVRKYGVKIVHNPKLCQQLGVFSKKDDLELNKQFLNYLENNYLIRIYSFNDGNKLKEGFRTKKNFLIYPEPYEKVFARYSPKRKRKLRLDQEVLDHSEIKEVSFQEVKPFIEANIIGLGKETDLSSFLEIFQTSYRKNYLKFLAFFYHGKIINVIATYSDCATVALLGTFSDKEYVKLSGASVLIDTKIKETIETNSFDFEGGDIPNIEEFFRGFRPELKPYGIIESSKKELFKKFGVLLAKGKVF
ncbi:hypothetical protein [Chryseobacterium artocarpi]|uniref:hypothetical protein n=1 Tax=Chryseobacterium artocarpi TaxID=1414727 RepID=UPI003F3FD5DA